MEEVVQQLEEAAISNNKESRNTFEDLYKNRGRGSSQEQRRQDILETQKSNRRCKIDTYRGIIDLVEAVEQNDITGCYAPTHYVSGFSRRSANYSDVLTMSEWMYEKPTDFAENWLAVPCPKGTRMLVVAHKGTTKCFNKYGNFRFECRTALPGGNPCDIKSNRSCVVLDCFYSKENNTMYVLDILAWNEIVMTDGQAAFRHYWLTQQLGEISELNIITKKNKIIFKILPKIPCDTESLNKLLMTFPFFPHNSPPVDGLFFYHQEANYFSGETPMVEWLFPFMVNEVLGDELTVHKAYMLQKPVDYTNYLEYIEKFEKKTSRRHQRKFFGPKDMDTSDLTQEDKDDAAFESTFEDSPETDPVPQAEFEVDTETKSEAATETMEAETNGSNGQEMEAAGNNMTDDAKAKGEKEDAEQSEMKEMN